MPCTPRSRRRSTSSRRSTPTTSSRSKTISPPSSKISRTSTWRPLPPPQHPESPHVAQVFRRQRTTRDLAGHPLRAEIAYGITSLNPGTADPARLLALSRAHWAIENKVHWVRDVTFDEDRSRVRKHAGAHVMASLRNLALSLLRLAGAQNIARALRRCGWERTAALRLIGIALA